MTPQLCPKEQQHLFRECVIFFQNRELPSNDDKTWLKNLSSFRQSSLNKRQRVDLLLLLGAAIEIAWHFEEKTRISLVEKRED